MDPKRCILEGEGTNIVPSHLNSAQPQILHAQITAAALAHSHLMALWRMGAQLLQVTGCSLKKVSLSFVSC